MANNYSSRSEADAAVVAALVNGGHSDDEIRAVFSNPAWRIGDRYREPAHGDRYLQRTIASARDFVAKNPLEPRSPEMHAPAVSAATAPKSFSYPLSMIFDLADFPKPTYIVDLLIREASFGFLGGEPKRLKSWLALYIALIIAAGEKLFGHFAVDKPRKVLFVEEEDDAGTMRERIELFRRAWTGPWPSDEFFRFAVKTGIRIHPAKDDPADLNSQFRALLADIKDFRPDIVFVDAFNRLHDGDENSQKDMTRVMGRFEEIRQAFGCTIILIHHFNKTSQGKSSRPNQRLRGSSVLASWSENSLFIMAKDADNTLRIEPESKHAAIDSFAIRMEQVETKDGHGLHFVYLGNPVNRKQAENQEKVLTALTDIHATVPDACTIKTLVDRTGLSASTVRYCLDALKDLKRVDYTPSKVEGKGQEKNVYYPVVQTDKARGDHG